MDNNTILYFITYFIVYSFAGWLLESIYKSICTKKFVNSGFLIGPYCPIYGFGAIIMLLTLSFLKEKPVLLFLASLFILSFWEYLVGLFLEKVFKTKYWDYSDIKFNIQGRVCLKNSIYWGLLGLMFIEILHPFIETQINQVPTNMLLYINAVIGLAMLVDLVASVVAAISFEEMIAKINEIGEAIKEKAKELTEREKSKLVDDSIEKSMTETESEAVGKSLEKSVTELEPESIVKSVAGTASQPKAKSKARIIPQKDESSENIEGIIAKLKAEQAKLKIRIYKQANRLKNAFPTMKSETITQFLSEKIDLKKLKQNTKKERNMKG